MTNNAEKAEAFTQNMLQAAKEYYKIFSTIWQKQSLIEQPIHYPIDPLAVNGTFTEAFTRLMSEPEKIMYFNMDLQQRYVDLWDNFYARYISKESVDPLYQTVGKDRRFNDESWEQNPFFDFAKQSYLLTCDWMRSVVNAMPVNNQHDSKKLNFYTRYVLDLLSPSNFLTTNPEVLKAALDSNGETIVKGLQNFYRDLANSSDKFSITTTDFNAFSVGKNLATTKGEVVFENDLMQLIQYYPTQAKTHSIPLLIIPAWINKYYILDLQEKNSLVKWLVDQGYTVFMISWVNPDKSHANKQFEDYLKEGPLAAIEAILNITKAPTVNAIGYCLGGTLLAITLAYLQKKKKNSINSATFLTTLLDFNDAGDMCLFIDQPQIRQMEKRMNETGYFSAEDMSQAFSLLRANDMIWSFFVNNYLLGKDPFPFDLLYWNADTTNLPSKMHRFYLKHMYQLNDLITPNKLSIAGVDIDLSTIQTPAYFLSTIEDHIAPWKNTFKAHELWGNSIRFVLSESGHVAGVVNPVNKNKYGHWVNEAAPSSISHQEWLEGATKQTTSWWNDWLGWNKQHAGELIDALSPHKELAIEPAPGRYVAKKANEAP